MIRVLGFDSQQGLGIFLFTTEFGTALGPTQPPIQWVPGALSLGVKQLKHEADNSPPSSAKIKEWVELYLHSPNTPSWHGAQLEKSTGTTLPLPLHEWFSTWMLDILGCWKNYFSIKPLVDVPFESWQLQNYVRHTPYPDRDQYCDDERFNYHSTWQTLHGRVQ
jgi:hypothetical protein